MLILGIFAGAAGLHEFLLKETFGKPIPYNIIEL
jgi:hypothetical protein